MRKLRIGIIDILGKKPIYSIYTQIMRANHASIMPQVVAVWCEQQGHQVFLTYYNGYQNMFEPLPDDLDVVFISSFTSSAQVAYALSNFFRSKGAITALGGPHARGYPEDSAKYFDYVFGFTDKVIVHDMLQGLSQQRPLGVYISSAQQPQELPGVRERWKHIERLLQKAPWIKMISTLGSFGCPYTCSFCIDSTVPHQPLDFAVIQDDLRFLLKKMKNPLVAWQDPNFGVRFNDYLDMIEEAVPPGSIRFMAESTLSLLKESNVKRLKANGFKSLFPGIESWYEMGYKTLSGKKTGVEKVRQVADQVNMILNYMPYLQANFVLGLDCDQGKEPFELTKHYIDLSPGTFPGFSMLTAFGRSSPLNLEYQKQNRVLAIPFHFLNNNTMNVRPEHYGWLEIYDRMIDLRKHAFSNRILYHRLQATMGWTSKVVNILRGKQDLGKVKYHLELQRRLREDKPFRAFFEQETNEIPLFFTEQIKKDLGPLWDWLPEGALYYDPNAYLHAVSELSLQPELHSAL